MSGGLRRCNPWFVNQISRAEAQGDRVVLGRDHNKEWVLKSPNISVGMVSSMSVSRRAWRACPFSGTLWYTLIRQIDSFGRMTSTAMKQGEA